MELQFQKNAYDCLRRATWEVKNEEQTQEVKLPEAMPDIGKVLGAWGQPLVRSKEWRGNGMGLSGGVMAWVLYAPEDGSMPRSVEAWVPFQMRFDFPETQRDGTILADCQLRSVDARSVSARKLMVRTVLSVAGEALEPAQVDVYAPCALPEDVKLLKKSYPLHIPAEAGEKTFVQDEDLPLPASCENAERLVYYTLQPEIMEKKVMGDKILFRGVAAVHALCRCAGEEMVPCDFELPFSQYAELEREYDAYATAQVIPAVTSLELDMAEGGKLRLKAGMVGQYTIFDRPVLEVVEDAYSPNRSLDLQMQTLEIPVVLEQQTETLKAEQSMETEGNRVLDISFTMEHPNQQRTEEQLQLGLPGTFQMLHYDAEGDLQNTTVRWDGTWQIPAHPDASMLATARPKGRAQASLGGGNAVLRSDIGLDLMAAANTKIPMVTGVELGEVTEPDPGRPSLILRRIGSDSLWDVAKRCGSTVEAICEANGLTDAPADDRFLVIPVV
ncbi:MAG: LysM peptidoglycan-binding domain-containing protein [Oscillospiraceae bacterium]|nr:LysM peptidoglycan-binding domain-containing protein [Oscillospiraceae bacterium]